MHLIVLSSPGMRTIDRSVPDHSRSQILLSALSNLYVVPNDHSYTYIHNSGVKSSLDFMLCSNGMTANGSSHVDFSISVSDHLLITNSFVIDSVLFKKDEKRRKWDFKCDWKKINDAIYKAELDATLDKIKIPFQLLQKSLEMTESEKKKILINIYCNEIAHAMRIVERCPVPICKVRLGSGIPGWLINLALQESCRSSKFWHKIYDRIQNMRLRSAEIWCR